MRTHEDIMLQVLDDLDLAWPLEADDWVVLGYTLNSNTLRIDRQLSRAKAEFMEMTLEDVADLISKSIWKASWNKEKQRGWLHHWHKRINEINQSLQLEQLEENMLAVLLRHPWIQEVGTPDPK